MKRLFALLLFVVWNFSYAYSSQEQDTLHQNEGMIVSACKIYSLLHRIAGEMRDKKTPKQEAVNQIQKLPASRNVKSLSDIVDVVYVKYSSKSPEWLAGYFMGICVTDAACTVEQIKPLFPTKRRNNTTM